MRARSNSALAFLLIIAFTACAAAQTSVSTACTYQGYLTDQQAPANGEFDLRFTLYDAAVLGAPVGNPVFHDDLLVEGGLFTVQLDYGAEAFNGDGRWLEIGVRPGNSGGAYTVLAPRQELTPSPYAVTAVKIKLPFAGTVASNVAAFKVTQQGTREAGVFEINNPASNWTALMAGNNGAGWSFQTSNTGAGGAAFMDVADPNNNSDVLQATQMGRGRAGFFEIVNPNNVKNALEARTNGQGYALWAEHAGQNAGLLANSQGGPGAEIITQAGAMPALVATNMGQGLAIEANGSIRTSRQLISSAGAGTAPLSVNSPTLVPSLNADLLDGQHLADLDGRYVQMGQAGCISTAMLQDRSVTEAKLAQNINASGIGFNAASVRGATVETGTWRESETAVRLRLHGGDVEMGGTGTHNDHRLRFKNNLFLEIRVLVVSFNDANSSVTTIPGGSTVDVPYPHWCPFLVVVSELGAGSDWTTMFYAAENDGRGSFLAINHDN